MVTLGMELESTVILYKYCGNGDNNKLICTAHAVLEERRCQLHPDIIDVLPFACTQTEKLIIILTVHVTECYFD